jgi:hypothetical protein
MSQKKSTKNLHTSNYWNQAISEAEKKIVEAKDYITRLRQAIRSFEVMRDSGEPWPGTSEAREKAAQRASST